MRHCCWKASAFAVMPMPVLCTDRSAFCPLEDIEGMRDRIPNVGPGAFAENLTLKGFDVSCLAVGDRLAVGDAILEVTQIGKNCHGECEIYRLAGECIMPKKGTFCSVIKSGTVRKGDPVRKLADISM